MSETKIIIPAKGNSIRLPNKNLRSLGGYPLLHWTIKPLLDSDIGEIIVSSESDEVLDFASKYDVKTHKRPPQLSLPSVHSSLAVLDAAISICNEEDIVGVALPTLPFRALNTLLSIKKRFLMNRDRSIVTIFSLRVSKNHILLKKDEDFERLTKKISFQDDHSSEALAFSGYLQLAKFKDFKKNKSFHKANPLFYEIPFPEAIDINTIEDFRFAEKLIPKNINF